MWKAAVQRSVKKLMNTSKVHLRVFALFSFEKDDVYNSLSVIQIVVLCKR